MFNIFEIDLTKSKVANVSANAVSAEPVKMIFAALVAL